MNVGNVVRTITIRGTSEGLDELTNKVNKHAAAQKGVAMVIEETTMTSSRLERAFKNQSLRLDEAARAQHHIARETKIANQMLDEQRITTQQHAQRVELINQAYTKTAGSSQKLAKQTGLTSYELLNFQRQVADVAVSLQAGQSPLTVAVQQGTQLFDIYSNMRGTIRGAFQQGLQWAGRFARSTAGVVTGVAAIGAGALYAATSWQDGQREIDRALVGVGKRAGATRGEINQMAEANAAGAKLSVSEWTTAATEFAKTGTIYKDNFKGIGDLVKGFAATTGESADEAAKSLAKIFGGDITTAADKLNAIYGNITGQTKQYARELEVAGKRQEAIKVLVNEVTPAIKQAATVTGFWARSWDAVSTTSSEAFTAIGKALSNMTGVGQDEQARMKQLHDRLENAKQAMALNDNPPRGTIRPQPSLNLLGKPEDTTARLQGEVAALQKQMEKLRDTQAFIKIGQEADAAVEAILPYLKQLENINEMLNKIKAAGAIQHPDEGGGVQQGRGAQNKEAAQAYERLKVTTAEVAANAARANEQFFKTNEAFGQASVSAERFLRYQQENLGVTASIGALTQEEGQIRGQVMAQTSQALAVSRDQLGVAQAVGVTAQMEAQHRATVNDQIRQGKPLLDAIVMADSQRAIQQAQITSQHQVQMVALQGQLSVAQSAVGLHGQQAALAQASAQHQATINNLQLQGLSTAQATQQADLQHGAALAQIAAQHAEIQRTAAMTLENLQLENAAINASSEAEADRIRSRQRLNELIAQGVDSTLAEKIAMQEVENSADRRAKAASTVTTTVQSTNRALSDAEETQRALTFKAEEEARWRERSLYNLKMMGIALVNMTGMPYQMGVDLFQSKHGGFTHTKESTDYTGGIRMNKGDITVTGQAGVNLNGESPPPTSPEQAATNRASAILAAGGSIMSAIDDLLAFDPVASAGTLTQLNQLLSEDEQITALQKEIAAVSTGRAGLEQQQLLKTLNDSLKQLTESTDGLNDTISGILSPLYTMDPRTSNLGFRTFADGGIMTAQGALPLRSYQGGGVADSPQMAMFGDGSVPEAYVPVPSGRIPVELKVPANNNRPIIMNFNAPVDRAAAAALKTTVFQGMQKAMAGMRQ